jgi:hypothetical protein
MTADSRVTPRPPPGAGYAVTVEFPRDLARALARREICKDATNHCRLGLVDFAGAALAVLDGPVTIAKSST